MILLTSELRYALRCNDINRRAAMRDEKPEPDPVPVLKLFNPLGAATWLATELRSEEHTSELQSLMRISYAVFCLKKKNTIQIKNVNNHIDTYIPTTQSL